MVQLIDDVQTKIKSGSGNLATFSLKLISGGLLGLTFALIGQTAAHYGTILFVFVLLMTTTVFLRLTREWAWTGVMLFDLIFVLIAILLRMYIVVAPG